MSHKPCDQFATDMLAAEEVIFRERHVRLKFAPDAIERIGQIVADVERVYEGVAFEDAIEHALECNEPYRDEDERDAYKVALGKIFGRRSAYKQAEDEKRGKSAPFAPR